MNPRHQDLADHVLSAFRAGMDEATQARIGDVAFKQLHALVCGALSQELDTVSGRLEALVRELRAEADRRELGL